MQSPNQPLASNLLAMQSFFVCKGISAASQTLLREWQMNFNELILLQCIRQESVNISAFQMGN